MKPLDLASCLKPGQRRIWRMVSTSTPLKKLATEKPTTEETEILIRDEEVSSTRKFMTLGGENHSEGTKPTYLL